MLAAIQKYLSVNKIRWKLVDECEDLKTVLDNVMKERAKLNIGMVPKQAELITYEFEETMWLKGILGEDKPDTLHNTVLFLLGMNCCLRAVEEHYYLRRDMPNMLSQLQFDYDECGTKCLVYREDTVTKTHDGGLYDMHNERKVVWIYPNLKNINRCPVRLVGKYLSLCPPYFKKDNFYLKARQKPSPTKWYSEQVVGQNTLGKVVKLMMKEAEISGYFTNHSARRTGSTRLFRAGIDRKLVKETTGHKSDAVDKYQITSAEQRALMSDIMANNPKNKVETTSSVNSDKKPEVEQGEVDKSNVKLSEKSTVSKVINETNIGEIVSELVKASMGDGKKTIKIQIEIVSE